MRSVSRTKTPEAACCVPMESALLDRDHSDAVDKRLARIEGQVRGLRKMVAEGRYCIDVLAQIQAVQESLRSTSVVLLEAHVRSCVHHAFASGTPERKDAVLKELSGLIARK